MQSKKAAFCRKTSGCRQLRLSIFYRDSRDLQGFHGFCCNFCCKSWPPALSSHDDSRISCFHEKEKSRILAFMKTIVIANQKGGSGKSTSTVHLAVAAEQAGDGPVVISDTDPQGSTVDWFNQRMKSSLESPRYAPLTLSGLSDHLRALEDAGASYLFIDTAPSIG